MRLKVDILNLREVGEDIKEDVLREAKAALRNAARALEQDLEAQTRGVVRGNAWRMWKSAVYPKGDKLSYTPSAEVWANGGKRTQGMAAYWTEPGVNRSTKGFWRAIPTKAAGANTRDRNLTPGEWERRTGMRLRYVQPRSGRGKWAMLVSDGTFAKNKSGALRKFTPARAAQGRERVIVPIFILIPEQAHANRVSIESAANRAQTRLTNDLAKRIARLN